MKNQHALKALVMVPMVAGLVMLAPVGHATGGAGGMTSQALAALTPAAVAALCSGGAAGAAGAAGGVAAGAAVSGLMAALCSANGVPLKALVGLGTSMLSSAMQGGGEGGGGGGGGGNNQSYNPGYNQVSGLPVISQTVTPRTDTATLNYNSVGSTKTTAVNQPAYNTLGSTLAPKLPDYGVVVPEVTKRRDFATFTQTQATAAANSAAGGVRLPNGQPARESGIRLGGFANGTVVASNGVNVGTSVATLVGEQKIDWFTLGYDDGSNGRAKQTFANPQEQFQYDSGYEMGVQYPVEKPTRVG